MESNLDSSKLRTMRQSAGFSQWQVALTLGRSQGWLSNIELGYVTPAQDVVAEIAYAIKTLDSRSKQQKSNTVNQFLKTKIIEQYGSQANFAQAIKTHEAVISRVVRNRMVLPPETMARWAQALGCKVENLFDKVPHDGL